jgi:hypothetical protein
MNALEEAIQKILHIKEQIASIDKDIEYHSECLKQKKHKSAILWEEYEEWTNKKQLLEDSGEMTEENKTYINQQIQHLINLSKNPSTLMMHIHMISPNCKYSLLEFQIRTELKEKGIDYGIVMKTNRLVVREMVLNRIQIPPYSHSEEYDFYEFYWSKEETPDLSIFKENQPLE